MSLAISPAARHLIVYNAPNDFTGQTEIDEYTAIANQDMADTHQLELGECENDVTAALRAGRERDLRADGRPGPEHVRSRRGHRSVRVHPLGRDDDRQRHRSAVSAVDDERRRHVVHSLQPRPESVPVLSSAATETIWNVDGLCNQSANEDGLTWLRLVRRNRRRWRRRQPVLGPPVLPARTGGQQPEHHLRERLDEVRAGPEGDPVPRGA